MESFLFCSLFIYKKRAIIKTNNCFKMISAGFKTINAAVGAGSSTDLPERTERKAQ